MLKQQHCYRTSWIFFQHVYLRLLWAQTACKKMTVTLQGGEQSEAEAEVRISMDMAVCRRVSPPTSTMPDRVVGRIWGAGAESHHKAKPACQTSPIYKMQGLRFLLPPSLARLPSFSYTVYRRRILSIVCKSTNDARNTMDAVQNLTLTTLLCGY